jgi:hypothetical protein
MGGASFGVLNQLLAEFSFYTNALLLDLYIQTNQDLAENRHPLTNVR